MILRFSNFKFLKTSLLILCVSLSVPLWALDKYLLIESLCDAKRSPRLLNSADIEHLMPEDNAIPLISPEGDFNLDGSTDVALSGIYDLDQGRKRFFLLVASINPRTKKPIALFFEEYESPVFLYTAGSTGDADPKDQCFSLSQCVHCSEGWDFYYSQAKKKFMTRPWKSRVVNTARMETVPAPEVPDELRDNALKLVGGLPDVIQYVTNHKKNGQPFNTRVTSLSTDYSKVLVTIYDKENGRENIYDEIQVNVKKNKVLRRKKRL